MRLATLLLVLVATAVPASSFAAKAVVVAPPDPLRFAEEIRAFEVADSIARAPRGAIVFYGSSSIRMWHERLAQDFAPYVVIGRGFGGSTMSEAAHWFDRAVVPLKPRFIVLYEGDNDLEMGRTPEQILADFDEVVWLMRHRLPEARLFVLSIKPSEARAAQWPAAQKTNARLAALCERSKGKLVFVDVATPLFDENGVPRAELYLEDRLHLSPAGYDEWQKVLRPVLVHAAFKLDPWGSTLPRTDRPPRP